MIYQSETNEAKIFTFHLVETNCKGRTFLFLLYCIDRSLFVYIYILKIINSRNTKRHLEHGASFKWRSSAFVMRAVTRTS